MNHALKEWNVVIRALATGQTIMLLRKGGIREVNGVFEVPFHDVWLYPTYEHQKPEGLKPPYAEQVQLVPSGWHPETVAMQARATLTHVIPITDAATLDRLHPFHVWTRAFALERFQWKPRSPLYVLLLRVYQLPNRVMIPFDPAYAGCRSWLDLNTNSSPSLDPTLAQPVLAENDYGHRVSQILEVIQESRSLQNSSNANSQSPIPNPQSPIPNP